MNFDLDDPLAGILSDGSDDSFFDDDILGKKKITKKKVATPISERKNALFDLEEKGKPKISLESRKDSLFDLGTTEEKKTPQDVIKTPQKDVTKSTTPFTRSVSKESLKTPTLERKIPAPLENTDPRKSPVKKVTSSADKLDFLGEINEPKKETFKPLEKGKSSQSLLDDILGGSSTKASSSGQVTRPVTAASVAKSQDFDIDFILNKSESKSTLASNKTVIPKAVATPQKPKDEAKKPLQKSIDAPKETTKKPKASDDWLGLFKDKKNYHQEEEMPAWLVGDSKKKKESEKRLKTIEDDESKIKKEETKEVITESKQAEVPELSQMYLNLGQFGVPSQAMVYQASNEDVAADSANLYLQQQESQLMLALQLKAQEEKLAAIQARQKDTQRMQREAARSHHSQLDAMLQRQAQQRQQMQALIAAHQERITERIKALLGSTSATEDPENLNENEYENPERKETPHMKEKKQLLQLVQSLQENHDKEIDLMETSYRRQLAFLEISVSQAEERMKEESDKLLRFYSEKITWLEEHHNQHRKLTEENLSSLAKQHKTENEMLRQQHLDNIRVLQEHHVTLMENMRNAVKQEQVLIQDSASFSTELHELVVDVKANRVQCQTLVDTIQDLTERTHKDSERSLQNRETQINDMIQQLKRERESFETEKSESRDMVKMLEMRMKQMTAVMEEDSASLKQKRMEFEFEKATFSKQTEFAKSVLQRQDQEVKMLKEEIQKEYEEKISKINEEKTKALKDSAAIAKEKVSIQNLKQEIEKSKAELQAQLEEVMEERTRINLEKQHTHIEEQRILAKSRDLDLLAKTAIEKQTQADQKYAEAELIQNKYEDRIRRMQEQAASLNAREKQIAKEKVALSRERLSLHNERKQIENKLPCSLCKSQNQYNYGTLNNFPGIEPYDTFQPVPASRDYGNVSSAMNAIEQEMAHLMSRNFNLKYSAGVNHDHVTENVQDGCHGDANQQLNSGAFKDYMDPKFMMLRLDVQQVLSNMEHSKKDSEQENGGDSL